MRRLRYSVPYIAGKKLPKDSDPAPRGVGPFSRASARCGRHFNPPAPCGAGLGNLAPDTIIIPFQSTRPLRGGTYPESRADTHIKISIHPSLAGRDDDDRPRQTVRLISIHPPLAGRDPKRSVIVIVFVISIHPPLTGRDEITAPVLMIPGISIHPPLAGRDRLWRRDVPPRADFNPPAPCGAGRSREI